MVEARNELGRQIGQLKRLQLEVGPTGLQWDAD